MELLRDSDPEMTDLVCRKRNMDKPIRSIESIMKNSVRHLIDVFMSFSLKIFIIPLFPEKSGKYI